MLTPRSFSEQMFATRIACMAKGFWHIGRCSLFQQLSPSVLAELEGRARVQSYPKGSAVYVPNDSTDNVFLLAEGRIRLCSITPDGKQATHAWIEPGEIFGELAVINPGGQEERAEAALASTVIMLPGDEVRRLMEASPAMSIGITKLIGFRRARIERRLRSLLFRSNRDRLIHLLVELAEQYGRLHSEGVLLTISLSHQELASIIGATRESVTMLLGEMQLEGLVRVSRKRLLVRDLRRLATIVELPVPVIQVASRAESVAKSFQLGTANNSNDL
jgi:CRP/FNR family transcriptional regulator, cyclic AMP receptor protein